MESYIKCSVSQRRHKGKENKQKRKHESDEKNSINKTEERVGFFKSQKLP